MSGGKLDRRKLLQGTGAGLLWLTTGTLNHSETSTDDPDGESLIESGSSAGEVLLTFDELTGIQYSSPTVIDTTLYIGNRGGGVYAIDLETGDRRWKSDVPSGEVWSAPAVVDGLLFVGSRDGSVSAFDATTGDQKWEFTEPDTVQSSPSLANDVLYIGASDGIYALDAATGEKQWYFDANGVLSSPLVVDGTLYAASLYGNVYAIDTATGEEVWSLFANRSVHSSPTIHEGTIYIGAGDREARNGAVFAIDAASGTEEWRFNGLSDMVRSTPTVANSTVYAGSRDGNVYALDPDSGEEEWTFTELTDRIESSPTIAGDTLYIGSEEGIVFALDAATGEQQWSVDSLGQIRSSPIVVDGILYVAGRSVHAIETGTSASSAGSRVSWGTFGHHSTWADEVGQITRTDDTAESGDTDENGGDDESDAGDEGDADDATSSTAETDDSDGTPGLGITGTLVSLGGVSYLLKRRLEDADETV